VAERVGAPDRDAELLAAAQAAASWARARRAAWTSEPLVVAGLDSGESPADESAFAPEHAAAATGAELEAPGPIGESPRGPALRWVGRAAVAAALAGVAYVGWPYLARALSTPTTSKPADTQAGSTPRTTPDARGGAAGRSRAGAGGIGTLRVKSNPASTVLVDGKPRGDTPVTLNDIPAGKHDVTLRSQAGTVRRAVTLAANETVDIDERIFPGFASVYLPFDITISENGKVLRPDGRNQIALSAGTHDFRLINRALGYDVVRSIEVKPGETTTLRLSPTTPLTVTATETMQVFVDGSRVGETPVRALEVAVGVHEVLVKKASGAERKYSVTVGGNPVTLNAAF
jgi:hypothetical protein